MVTEAHRLGAWRLPGDRAGFRVWAPRAQAVRLCLGGRRPRTLLMRPEPGGYHELAVRDVPPGSDYGFRVDDGACRPDPASRWQPNGVHGLSRLVEPGFAWTDAGWRGVPLRDWVVYELHVGTYTAAGTLDAAVTHLAELRELGVTVVELMPLAEFPGARNWGYDGVSPFAVQSSYGGPEALRRFVDAAHAEGLAVVLDVVYNHLGPEGNYLGEFGPYFTDRYRTPWGQALNFDGPDSDGVRHYFVENALQWQTDFRLDGLRLDAVHAIRDFSAVTFLEELGVRVGRRAEALGRPFRLIAESDMNMARHILPRSLGGYGMDAQWSDDFHHCLHVLLTGERTGYYADFGGVERMAKVWREGYAYTGEYSRHRRHAQGSSPAANPAKQFVVCNQNHDQVGNRLAGDRLTTTLTPGGLRLAAAATLLSPFVPMLFMGEEYGETAPFQYFVSHGDPALVEAVRRGRREEFAAFDWTGEVPDPQAESTFRRCCLNRGLLRKRAHRQLRDFYRECLRLRRELPALRDVEKDTLEAWGREKDEVLVTRCWTAGEEVLAVFHFGSKTRRVEVLFPRGTWVLELDSELKRWGGDGSGLPVELRSDGSRTLKLPPHAAAVYRSKNKEAI